MTARKFFSILNLITILVVLFCDIAPLVSEIQIPAMVATVAHIALPITMVLSMGFKGFIKFLLSLVLMYVIYVGLTGGLMLLGVTYELADLVGTVISLGFMFVMSSKI